MRSCIWWVHCVFGGQQALGLAAHPDVGGRAQAEGPQVVVELACRNRSAASTVAMLDDWAIAPVIVRWMVPCVNQSWIGRSSRSSRGDHDLGARGDQAQVEQELTVSTFSTEPGS